MMHKIYQEPKAQKKQIRRNIKKIDATFKAAWIYVGLPLFVLKVTWNYNNIKIFR